MPPSLAGKILAAIQADGFCTLNESCPLYLANYTKRVTGRTLTMIARAWNSRDEAQKAQGTAAFFVPLWYLRCLLCPASMI
jgi:hypothetical protein